MSVLCNSTAPRAREERSTNIVATNSDYTALCWFRNNSTPAAGDYKTVLIVRDNAYDDYVWLGSGAGNNDYRLEGDISGTFPTTPNVTLTNGAWNRIAYTRTGNTHRFYANGVLIGSFVLDITSATFTLVMVGNDDGGALSATNVDVAYFREYNAALTLDELNLEFQSETPVRTSNLVADCPLQADRFDDSGNGNDFTEFGTLTYTSNSPINNTTPSAARQILSLPFSATQNVRDGFGVAQKVYYKYTAVAGDKLLGSWGYGDGLTPYTPTTKIFQNEALTQKLVDTGSGVNKPVQSRLEAGTTYYLEYTPNAGNPNPAILQVRCELGPQIALVAGDIFVNDDSAAPNISGDWKGLPGIIVDPSTGNVKNSFNGIPAGEGADTLVSGKSLIADAWNDKLKLFDKDFNLLTTISATISFEISLRSNHGQNWFYTGNGTAIKAYDDSGTLQGSWTVAVSCRGLAANLGGTVLYYSERSSGGAIRRHDLSLNSAMSNLVGGIAGYFPGDILVLGDDSIVVMYHNTGTAHVQAIRYDSTGATLNTYDFGTSNAFPGGGTFPRLSYDTELTDNFRVWTHDSPTSSGLSRFRRVKVSDGSILFNITTTQYEVAIYNPTPVTLPLSPDDRFGVSFSCPFFTLLSSGSTGTIIVQKETIPTDTTLFDINTVNLSPSTYQLADGDSRTHSGLTPASNYEVSETPNGLYDTVISVSNGSPANAISVAAGETVTVTITNTLKSAADALLTVGKVTDPLNLIQLFAMLGAGGLSPANFSLHSEESIDFHVVPGTYSVVETTPNGFKTTYLVSNDPTNNDNENIVIGSGEIVTLMVLNEAFSGGLFFPDPTFPGGNYPPGTGKTSDRVPGASGPADVQIPNPFYETAFLRNN